MIKSKALNTKANFNPPKTAPKMRLIKPKAAILITFVSSLASRLTKMMMTTKMSANTIPAGGTFSKSK